MGVEIGFDVALDQRLTVAKLTFDAFRDAGRMLVRFFGGERKAEVFVASFLRGDRLLVASIDGSVVGFAGLEFFGKGFMDIDAREAVSLLGFRGFFVYLGLWGAVFFSKTSQSTIVIRALAVSSDKRGEGIGTKLLCSVIEYARLNGFSEVKLEVTGANPDAKRLYGRVGFRVSRVQKIPYVFSRFFGFDRIVEMTYGL
jgi:ribosomal protein S18 acetylase RimI-like enzyme